ncbi:MAG: hypothetical protein ACPLXC_00100 [Candidatus Pacearchaeota archaeon]
MAEQVLHYFGRKVWRRILEETLEDYDIQYKKGPFYIKEEELRTKNHRYRTDNGYIDDEKGIIVINCDLPRDEREITLNHELIHGRYPNLSEKKVENLALELFNKYQIGYDFYKSRKQKTKGKEK